MSKYLVIAFLFVVLHCETGIAQGRLKGKLGGGKRDITVLNQGSGNSTNRRQDVEGAIWEYKVIDQKEKDPAKQTVMTGRLRIKQTSVFAVGKAKLSNAMAEEKPNAEKRPAKGGGSDVRGQLKGLLSQRPSKLKEQDTGGERVGDFSRVSSTKYNYQFDEDDDYPLSGLVNLIPDAENKSKGVWSGNYEEFSGGKKVKRWRFEMRKIEE